LLNESNESINRGTAPTGTVQVPTVLYSYYRATHSPTVPVNTKEYYEEEVSSFLDNDNDEPSIMVLAVRRDEYAVDSVVSACVYTSVI
jgi:hypothetical protein